MMPCRIAVLVIATLSTLCPHSAAAQFVQVQGDQLVLNGNIVRVKGSNYYPKNHYWQNMWPDWDPAQIAAELDLLEAMGGNTLRILVPFDFGWTDANGYVNATYLGRLDQLVGWCSDRGMRPIITLFDWRTNWSPEGSFEETRDLRYLTAIVNRFRNDARVLLWDVKNEPDNPGYGGWVDDAAGQAKIDWLERMCAAVHALDSNHPVGVGMTTYTNNYYGIGGKSVHSFVDVILFHNYNGPDTVRQINEQKSWNATQFGLKPILLEETGWPTNPAYDPAFTEAAQLAVYQQVMAAVRDTGISGIVQWVLVDFQPGVGDSGDSYGILRTDYSRKPAADVFQNDFTVTPFPPPPPPPLDIRIDLAPTDIPDGITRANVVFDGETDAYADIAGRACRKPRASTNNYYLYLNCDDARIYGNISDVYVAVDYLQGGGGNWHLEYDGLNNAYTQTAPVAVSTGAQSWATQVFHLTDAKFMNGQQGGAADMRLNCLAFADGNKEDWFASVRVHVAVPTPTVTPTPSPPPTVTPTPTPPQSSVDGVLWLTR